MTIYSWMILVIGSVAFIMTAGSAAKLRRDGLPVSKQVSCLAGIAMIMIAFIGSSEVQALAFSILLVTMFIGAAIYAAIMLLTSRSSYEPLGEDGKYAAWMIIGTSLSSAFIVATAL